MDDAWESDDIIGRLREKKEDEAMRKQDAIDSAKQKIKNFGDTDGFSGVGVHDVGGSLTEDVDYQPNLLDTNIPKKVEVRDVLDGLEDAVKSKGAIDPKWTVHEGKFGMNICSDGGVMHKTALDVVRSWGVVTDGIPKEKMDVLVNYFLLSMRNRFIERYETMLSCVASVREYADFKGVPYSTVSNHVFGNRKGRGKNPLDLIKIGGTTFILVKADEFYEWHKFLAEKGAKEMVSKGKKDEASYLANIAGDMSLVDYDSVDDFLSLYEGGLMPEGGNGGRGSKGYHADALRGKMPMDAFYDYYSRWAKYSKNIEAVSSLVFRRKVYGAGYRRWNNGSKRGIYFYRKDGKPIGTKEGELKIPHRGSYTRRKKVAAWHAFENMGGKIKR